MCIYGALALALRFQVVFLRSSNNKLVILSLLVSFWLPCFLPSCPRPRPRPRPCPCLSFPRSLLLYGPHLRRASVARPRGSASHRGCQAGPSDPDRPFPQGAWRDLREVFPALVLPARAGSRAALHTRCLARTKAAHRESQRRRFRRPPGRRHTGRGAAAHPALTSVPPSLHDAQSPDPGPKAQVGMGLPYSQLNHGNNPAPRK